MFEIIRRIELIAFLSTNKPNYKPHVLYTQNLLFSLNGVESECQFVINRQSFKEKNKNILITLQNQNFINSPKHGILLKMCQKLFKKDWEERYCVLTNIGLLYFNDERKKPSDLIPICG